jgi:hypothetical protein
MPRPDDSDLEPRPRRRRRPRPEPDSHAYLLVVLLCVGIVLAGGAAVTGYLLLRPKPGGGPGGLAVGVPGTELERLAGTWESTFRDPTGRVTMYKVKEIRGTTETVTWYRPDGSVFQVNRVEFRLEERGPNKVFRYFNGWVTHGPGPGQPFPPGEYLYTLEGDAWTEYEPSGGVIVWTRRR